MKSAWNPSSGFEALKAQIDDELAFVAFANAVSLPTDAVNMLITVIIRTRIFANQYKEWHTLPINQRGYAATVIWWANKTRVKTQL